MNPDKPAPRPCACSWPPPQKVSAKECDCGEVFEVRQDPCKTCGCENCWKVRRRSIDACPRCEVLDGRTPRDQELIGLLRELGGLTLKELVIETQRPARAILFTIRKLERVGRVSNRTRTGGRQNQANVYHLVEPR